MVRLSSTYNVHPLEKEYVKRKIQLRDYQEEGIKTMVKWFEKGKGGINGDEMGLGKTCQAIVFMTILHSKGAGPFIVSAPLSVIPHWVKEVTKFSCGVLKPINTHPATRMHIKYPEGLEVQKNMVFVTSNKLISTKKTSHPILRVEEFLGINFRYVIIDEAHVLKGRSMFRKLLYENRRDRRFLLLTGTPLQNNVAEAFSLLQFIDDSFCGIPEKEFVSEHSTGEGLLKLKRILSKFMIRRLKADVMELPESNEIVMYHGLSPLQRKLYLQYLEGKHAGFRLSTLFIQLRKMVSHPYLFRDIEPEPYVEGEHLVLESGKMRLFSDLCRYLKSRKHKVLVFCQFITTCLIIEDFMDMRGYKFQSMRGETKMELRGDCVDTFQNDPNVFAFIMTTKTGGVGLTLTAADTVVFFDTDFNPHNDLQAMARTHRIGQNKQVRVIRLIGSGTVDDYVYNVAFQKLKLHKGVTGESIEPRSLIDFDEFRRMYSGSEIQDAVAMSDEDIEKLLGKTNTDNLWEPFVDNDENFVQDCDERPARLKDFMDYEGSSYRGVRNKNIREREEKSWGDYKPVQRKEKGFYAEPDDSIFRY
ncbi:unnamed protein product [Auanema sp. JU1783]|nr:unnamed protein product [Auanema sp. JU1783]